MSGWLVRCNDCGCVWMGGKPGSHGVRFALLRCGHRGKVNCIGVRVEECKECLQSPRPPPPDPKDIHSLLWGAVT